MAAGLSEEPPRSQGKRVVLVLAVLFGAAAWWVWPGQEHDSLADSAMGTKAAPRVRPMAKVGRSKRDLPTRKTAGKPLPAPDGTMPDLSGHADSFLSCRLSEAIGFTKGLASTTTDGFAKFPRPAFAEGTIVQLPVLQQAEGKLKLHLEGFEPTIVRWSTRNGERTCQKDPVELIPREEMTLTGRVLNTAGNPEPDARVHGCGPSKVNDDGTFLVFLPQAPCTLQAARQDGFWYSRSDRSEVPWIEGGSYDVDLVLNEYPRGGMGISIGVVDLGIKIQQVHAGSPAAEAGLRSGDIILELDGEFTVEMDLETFVDRGTGEAGTDVTLRVLSPDGRERQVSLTRAMLGP